MKLISDYPHVIQLRRSDDVAASKHILYRPVTRISPSCDRTDGNTVTELIASSESRIPYGDYEFQDAHSTERPGNGTLESILRLLMNCGKTLHRTRACSSPSGRNDLACPRRLPGTFPRVLRIYNVVTRGLFDRAKAPCLDVRLICARA